MQHFLAAERHQFSLESLRERIALIDPVRYADAFTEKMDLLMVGFQLKDVRVDDRHSLQPRLFLEIYVSGCQRGIRFSRRLKKSVSKKPKYRKAWRSLSGSTLLTPIRPLCFYYLKIAA